MSSKRKRTIIFPWLITASLCLPVLISLVLIPSADVKLQGTYPVKIGEWIGKDLKPSDAVANNYSQLDNKLVWRRYSKDKSPFVECIVQEATNNENLHDLFMCLVYSNTDPRRIELISTPGRPGQQSTVYLFKNKGVTYCSMFAFQTRSGHALYPPASVKENLQLMVIGRQPCRLIEIATPIKTNKSAAISRIKEIAAGICSSPL